MMDELSRRKFLELLGAMGIATLPEELQAKTGKAPGELKEGYSFFTDVEAAFIEAAVDRLIPHDELAPGALEAGVSYFIDQQLSGSHGTGAKMCRQGPWSEGTEQGYQLPLRPQQVYLIGIAETDSYCMSRYGKNFSALSAKEQEEVLLGLEGGSIKMDAISGKDFFSMLYANTIEGFFADPIYGGNRDTAGSLWDIPMSPPIMETSSL